MPCFKLLEDDQTLAFMDIYPAKDGQCLVVAKDHYPTLFEISDEAFAAVSRSVSRIARAVNQALSPVRLNLVQANGPGAGQSVAHFHMHVIPRNRDDELKLNWSAKSSDPQTIAEIADKIRANL